MVALSVKLGAATAYNFSVLLIKACKALSIWRQAFYDSLNKALFKVCRAGGLGGAWGVGAIAPSLFCYCYSGSDIKHIKGKITIKVNKFD